MIFVRALYWAIYRWCSDMTDLKVAFLWLIVLAVIGLSLHFFWR